MGGAGCSLDLFRTLDPKLQTREADRTSKACTATATANAVWSSSWAG
jgi:hypothetical protein